MKTALHATPTLIRGTRMSMKLYSSHFGILRSRLVDFEFLGPVASKFKKICTKVKN